MVLVVVTRNTEGNDLGRRMTRQTERDGGREGMGNAQMVGGKEPAQQGDEALYRR